ncbi:MAG: hypothetical protein ACYCT1_12190 [Steroidobacteraceae bacterium]
MTTEANIALTELAEKRAAMLIFVREMSQSVAQRMRDSVENLRTMGMRGGGGYGTVFEICGWAHGLLEACLNDGAGGDALSIRAPLSASAGVL